MNAQPHAVDQDIIVIAADDSINDDASDAVIGRLESQIIEGGARKIVVDCSGIEFLSSYGLGMMLRLRNAADMVGGEVKLSGLNPMLTAVLETTQANRLFKAYPDVEQARLSF